MCPLKPQFFGRGTPIFRIPGYYCVVCGKWLQEQDGVIVHDPVPHPIEMTFDEEENPQ